MFRYFWRHVVFSILGSLLFCFWSILAVELQCLYFVTRFVLFRYYAFEQLLFPLQLSGIIHDGLEGALNKTLTTESNATVILRKDLTQMETNVSYLAHPF